MGMGGACIYLTNVEYVGLFADSKHYKNVDDPSTLQSLD